MNKKQFRAPPLKTILPDLLAFVLGLGIAFVLEWETTDLVWSLWLCSLALGYATILSTIAGATLVGIKVIAHEEFKRKHLVPAILLGGTVALFFVGFFSLHFGAFHAGHSVFLQMFFPAEGVPDGAFGDGFMNPFLLWAMVIDSLVVPYGLFLVPALIAERKHVFASFISCWRIFQEKTDQKLSMDTALSSTNGKKKASDPFTRPYVNVVRMHLLIFFFGFCHALKLDSFIVYAVVYAVYFFPWREFKTNDGEQGINTDSTELDPR